MSFGVGDLKKNHQNVIRPSFYQLTTQGRKIAVQERTGVKIDQMTLEEGGISVTKADTMIENVIGKLALPLAVVPSLKINHKEYTVPMSIEEPSVVAAISSIAKLLSKEGLTATSKSSLMIGQVHLPCLNCSELEFIRKKKEHIIFILNKECKSMVARGGGVKDIKFRQLSLQSGEYSIDISIDVCDAMGANLVNTISEKAKSLIQNMGIKTGISILSNYCVDRTSAAQFKIPVEQLQWKGVKGEQVARKIIEAYEFAMKDTFRAVTHNKGVMNGIDAVCMATGQDWRAVEAAAHAYACKNGKYQPLTHYFIEKEGNNTFFKGLIELPLSVGTVGGSIDRNSLYRKCHQILGNPNTQELSQIIVCVGLCQNFAALRALAIEGIQKGHMKLHARSIASKVGVPEYLIPQCCNFMQFQGRFDQVTARKFLEFYGVAKL